jgi:subtilisin family serine protease
MPFLQIVLLAFLAITPSDELQEQFQEKENVQVIITFNATFDRFYDLGDLLKQRTAKRQEFDSIKQLVTNSIADNGTLLSDLEIINSIGAAINQQAFNALLVNPMVKDITLSKECEVVLDESVDLIGASVAWLFFDDNGNPITGQGIKIAILDTGIDYAHPDLGGCFGAGCKVVDGWDFHWDDADPMDDHGHGTHVASIAAGNGFLLGVAPNAQLVSYKVCSPLGTCYDSYIIAGIDRCTDPNQDGDPSDHLDVVNISLGGPGSPNDNRSMAINNSTDIGVLYVISAGNSGPGGNSTCRDDEFPDGSHKSICSPGMAEKAITVAAGCKSSQHTPPYCENGPIADFSSRGPVFWHGEDLQKPDITAPGVFICAAQWEDAFDDQCFDDEHVSISGTSMAAPHISGAAALIKQAMPELTPNDIKQLLKDTTRDLNVEYDQQGAGIVDLRIAIPSSISIDPQPNQWYIVSDPSTNTNTFEQPFELTFIDQSIESLDIELAMDIIGLSLESNVAQLIMPENMFSATLTINNSQTIWSNDFAEIRLTENEQLRGIIPVYVTMTPTIEVYPTDSIDYGIDEPHQDNWISPSQYITITNLIEDNFQSIEIVSSDLPQGIEFFVNPAIANVDPGSELFVETWYAVDNTQIPNGKYGGDLTIMIQSNSINILTEFQKACLGDINLDGMTDITDLVMLLGSWGESAAMADVNNDGIVNISDLLILLANWGVCTN